MIARRVRVTGRVQGVFFRAWVREEARMLGVSGWVRNCADGSVEAQLEGAPADLDELLDALREGPPDAQVDRVDVKDTDPEGLGSFEVRH